MDEKFIPKLRFSGFKDNWENTKIGDCLDVKYGKDYKHLNKGKYPVLGTGGIMEYVDEFLYSGESILIGRKGTIDKPKYIDDSFWTVDTLFYTEIKKQFPKFLFYCISNINWLKYNEASGVPSLSANNIKNVKINIPELIEQKKIANFLTSIDYKIELLDAKHKYYVEFKRYLMQQIFTQKLRFQDFTDDWVVTTLDKIAIKIGDGLHSTPDYVENSNYYFINGNNLLEGQIIINDNTKCIPPYEFEKYNNNLNKNTILISINGTIGNLAYYNDEKVILGKSAAYIKLNENIEKEYIYNYLKIGKIQHYFSSELTGTTIKNLSLKTLKNTPIIIPSYNEQKIIANMFKNIDLKIDLINNRLTNMKNFKKGLLQQMFI